MKRLLFITLVIFLLLLVQQIQAGVSVIMNGSFENNGHQIADITTEAPKRWCDVNIPSSNFLGWVGSEWSSHGYNGNDSNCLTLYSGFGEFSKGEKAMTSQQVYLKDVNEIIFDIKLEGDGWSGDKRSAVVIIDGSDIIWDSNTLQPGGAGQYHVEVNDIDISDPNLHTLSLVLKVNEDESDYIDYWARWDFISFDTYCRGFGYLPEDLNQDCIVDSRDFALLAGQWLIENPNERYDLIWTDKVIIDGLDLGAFTEYWLARSDANGWFGENRFPPGLLEADLNNDGIVDFRDFTILSGDWKSPADCTRGDIDCSKMVDYEDVLIMADEWLGKSWLYGL